MKNLILTLVLFNLAIVTGHAQNYTTEFGKVAKDEMDLVTYDKDTSAEAIVLFDIGMSYFVLRDNRFNLIFEQSKRIKILKEAGLNYAEIEIPFYRNGDIFESIYDLEAFTYNTENGILSKIQLDLSNTHDEKINEYWMSKKFAMPNVKVGSIIEYRYKLSSQDVFGFRDWSFQEKIPTIYSSFIAKMIPFYEYSYVLQGASKFDYQNIYESKSLPHNLGAIEYKDYVHEFAMKDVPAFKSESYITSMNDYIIKVIFQLSKINYTTGGSKEIISTWPALIKELDDNSDFGRYVSKSEKLAEKTIDIKAISQKTKKEAFEEVINYMKTNYRWNEYYGKYASKSPANIIKDKYGNVADLNLLTIGFLNAAGIEAYPVLISTRKNGKILSDYPFLKYFNYVLIYAKLDDENVLSDVTDINCSPFRIPVRCINERGLLIKEDTDAKWIGLKSAIPSEKQTTITMHFEGEELITKVEISANEYQGISLKEQFGNDTEKVFNYLKDHYYDVLEDNISITYPDNYKQDYQLEFKPNVNAEIINGKIYISPFLNESMKDNPLNQETRTYPIDMIYPWKDSFTSIIEIPEGYKVDFVPENFKARNNLVEMEYLVTQTDNKLVINFTSYFKMAEYPANEYSKIKFYMNQMVKKGNEKIVLVKI